MNKVIKVSINKTPFTLAEDAYSVLKVYLDHLRRYYSGEDGGAEIMDGIEERIAELLSERTEMGNKVVSKANVDEVLEIMGTPEVIEDISDEAAGRSYDFTSDTKRIPKRLYRDTEHRVIGGVCSGLAAYFNIDTILVRVLLIALVLGSSAFKYAMFNDHLHNITFSLSGLLVLVYIVMWIIVPAARSVEDRYAMRGEPLSAREVQNNRRRRRPYRYEYERKNTAVNRSGGNRFWYVIGRIFAILIGGFFLLVSTSVLIGFVVAFFAGGYALSAVPTSFLDLIAFSGNPVLFKIFILMVIGLPLIGLIYLGCVLLFNIRGHKWLGVSMIILWIASILGLIAVSAHGLNNFRRTAEFNETIDLALTSDTLYIELKADREFPHENYLLEADESHYRLGWIEGKRKDLSVTAFPGVTVVRQSNEETPYVRIKSQAFGSSERVAEISAEESKPVLSQEGNVLSVHAFTATEEHPWKGNLSKIRLYVPHDMTVIVRDPVQHEFGVSPRKEVKIFKDFDF